jgi:hypothetical protein
MIGFLSIRLPLEGLKRKIVQNLRLLERDGLVSKASGYQEIVNAIARVSSLLLFPFKWLLSAVIQRLLDLLCIYLAAIRTGLDCVDTWED